MSDLIISVSGLRGIVGVNLDPEVAMRFATAFADYAPPGPVLISRDGRATGKMMSDAVRAALCAVGRQVIDADVAATPTAGVLVRQLGAAGGIQISASHNPPEYNGIKLFDQDGKVLSAESGAEVVARYERQQQSWVPHNEVGSVVECEDTLSNHARMVLATVNVQRIRGCNFRVLLDSNHGAGGLLGCHLLKELHCHVEARGSTPTGQFVHPPEPTAENLSKIRREVTSANAAVGFCQDPDADRLAVIDELGRYIGEEYTLAICLEHVLSQRLGTVVTNCATSRMAEDLAKRFGVPFFRSAVGEAHVVNLMQKEGAVFGGEGNGGPIDPRVGYIRDSFVGMALILDAIAERGRKLSEIVDELPRYAIHKTKVSMPTSKVIAAFDALQTRFADAAASRLDGIRLDWSDRWLLVRASNTEPIVRVIAEAPNEDQAGDLCDQATAILEKVI